MNIKHLSILLAVALSTVLPARECAAAEENLTDAIEVLRSTYKADRQAFLAETLQMAEAESAAFWPLYHKYRAEIDKVGDGLVKLALEYADLYPDVPENRAAQLLKDYAALEKKLVGVRASYLKKARKVLPASKVLRWAQLENRMDIALRLQLASTIPLVPTDKEKP